MIVVDKYPHEQLAELMNSETLAILISLVGSVATLVILLVLVNAIISPVSITVGSVQANNLCDCGCGGTICLGNLIVPAVIMTLAGIVIFGVNVDP